MRTIRFRGFDLYGNEQIGNLFIADEYSKFINNELVHTVGQFTGLLDVDNNEIYEGDIVILTEIKFSLQQYEVRYYQGSFILVPYGKDVEDIYEESYHIDTFAEEHSEKCKLKIVNNINTVNNEDDI